MLDSQIIMLITTFIPAAVSVLLILLHLLIKNLPENKLHVIMEVVEAGVHAAEQIGTGKTGTEKKQAAEDFIHTSLAALGIKINPAFIDAGIESVVYALNQQKRLFFPPVDTSNNHG